RPAAHGRLGRDLRAPPAAGACHPPRWMRLELHCHSTCSDGSLPAAEVARLAHARGATLFCLTDHDTDRGFADSAAAVGEGCTVLRGLELSCREYDRSVHILLYGLKEGP